MSPGRPLEIAIVGMSCRSPGAPDLFAYWESVLADRHDPSVSGVGERAIDVVEAALEDAGLRLDVLDGPRVRTVRCGASSPALLDEASQALTTREVDLAVIAGELIEADDRSRGGAALILKRRADAERDGDRIYAVVQEVLDAASPVLGRATPAVGLAGLIQAALALYHRVRPPDLHAARPWIHAHADAPRRAEVNDLAVLEEHAGSADAEPVSDAGNPGAMLRWETEAILLSARDRAGLADRARDLNAWLEDHPDAALKDIAYTLNCADDRGDVGIRLGLVASSPADLAARLAAVLTRLDDPECRAIGDGRGTYHWDDPLDGLGRMVFLFPGEGSQYAGMLADLCVHFPEVRRQFDTADRIALEQGDVVPPSAHLFGDPDGAEDGTGLWSAPTAVNLVLNAQWALYQVLTRLGLRPDAVAGHSSGEILALAAAGVLRTDRELECQLGRLGAIFRGLESAGDTPAARLVAVATDRGRAEAACRAAGAAGVAVAIDNCPHQVVLAGPHAEVDRVVAHLRAENILVEVLPFDRAYHTPAFAAVLGPIADSFAGLKFRAPRLPVYSCATRERMPADPEAIRSLVVEQWTRTVAFRETVEAMYSDDLRIFIDVGARGNLAGFVQDTLRGRKAFAIATNLPRRSGLTQLNHLMAALFAHGVPIRPAFLYSRRRPRRIDALVATVPPVGCSLSSGASQRAGADHHDRHASFREHDGTAVASMESLLHPRSLTEPDLLPVASRFRFDEEESPAPVLFEVDATMLRFQETMRVFLETQQAVIEAYTRPPSANIGAHRAPRERTLATTSSGPEPGPWVGEVRRLVPGSELESVYILDARRDPIAEHHTLGGRRVSALDPSLKGLPVLPFAVMAEMTAQAGAMLVPPGLVLVRLTQVCAHKWVRYEDEPVVLELRGRREPSPQPGEERAWVGLFNRGPGGRSDVPRPVFEAVAVFAARAPDSPPADAWVLEDARPSRFTAESIYAEQWLFHGPAMQAVVEVGRSSMSGIDGSLRVLPWEPLVEHRHPARLHTDVIVIDSFTHLLGCWGLDHLADRGDVVFPLRMEELRLYGERPAAGADVACRIAIKALQRHSLRVEAEIVRPDGTVWMRLHDWENWRFHWPSRYRDVFRQPQDVFIGEEWPIDDRDSTIKAVWLAPPADMGRPVWRDVLEHTQLGPAERAEHLATGGPEEVRSRRLWGRIAAKEAARRLWHDEGRGPTYPADLAIVADERGRPVLTWVDDPHDRSLPAIAVAGAEGVAVAIAARDSRARLGVAVASISGSPHNDAPSPTERAILSRWAGPARSEWSARFRCAREAAARSIGMRIDDDPTAAEVVQADATSGVLRVRIAATTAKPMPVATARRGESVWAWTSGEGVDP
jgi:malonyl CoA-acyl carrier protein transacylase